MRMIEIFSQVPPAAWVLVFLCVLMAAVVALVIRRANAKARRQIQADQREQAIARIAHLYGKDKAWVRRQISTLVHDKAVSEDEAIGEMLEIVT